MEKTSRTMSYHCEKSVKLPLTKNDRIIIIILRFTRCTEFAPLLGGQKRAWGNDEVGVVPLDY